MKRLRQNNGQLDPLVTKARFLLLNAVIVLLFLGHFFDLAFDKEHWPFSQYPMYAQVNREYSYKALRLYGVVQGEPHSEILLHSSDYTEPFGRYRLEAAFWRIASKPDPEKRQQSLNEALLDFLLRYEKQRLDEQHDGPPLQSARLYEQEWQLDARAANVYQPNHRELIAEVEQP